MRRVVCLAESINAVKPLMVDLFAGLGGWAEGGLAEGYDVIGFDIEQHVYGDMRYPAQLVIQDVLTLHGSQFKNACLIVCSPPCQAYSYRAMPWKKAKALPPPDNTLFESCFRIQREASEAAGHHVPLVVENVRGAQKWVGRARWNFGSFYLWGDVPALMPSTFRATMAAMPALYGTRATKNEGGSWFNIAHNTTSGKGQNPDGRKVNDRIIHVRDGAAHTKHLTNPAEHIKQPGLSGVRSNGKGDRWFQDGATSTGSKSTKRKAASAMIAKIPLALSRHIAAVYRPKE